MAAETPPGAAPLPAFVQFGGQTPLNLAAGLAAAGVPLLGASLETIDQAEDRVRFSALVDRLGIPQPEGGMARSIDEAEALAERIGYPVIVRPSFVIGGLAIDFAYSRDDLVAQLAAATVVDPDRPVRIDRYLEGVEVDVDAVADGETVLIPGLLEHVERAGVHSGDSVGIFPPQTVSEADQALIVASMERIVRALGVRGLVNAQFIVREDGVYLIEVNPRASRTVPFMSKVTGVPLVDLAVRIALGGRLADLGWPNGLLPAPGFVAVKAPAFSTAKLRGVDPSLGPFMQSTGEVIGIHEDARVATAKALVGGRRSCRPAAGRGGALALLSVADRDKALLGPLATALAKAGYRFAATPGTRVALAALGHAAEPVAKLGGRAGPGEVAILDLIASGRRPARRQHADSALGAGPGCRRHPPRRDRRGRPLPDGDGDGGGGGGGDRPGARATPRRGAPARRVGPAGRRAGRAKPDTRRARTRGMTTPQIAFDTQPGEYRAGACNIGPAEIARRRRAGYAGLGAAVRAGRRPPRRSTRRPPPACWWRIPLAAGATGLLQARFRFCAGFGMAGVRNFGALGSVERVEDAAARRADRAKALRISLAAAAIGGVGALAFALLPL